MKIFLLVLLVVFVFLMLHSQRLEKLWREYWERDEDQVSRIGRLRAQTSQWLNHMLVRIRPKQPLTASPTHFAAWVRQSVLLEGETKLWFQSLSPEHLAVLTQFVNEFCQSMGFELNWLLNEQVAENRNLQNVLTAVVKHYLEACWLTVAVREDLLAFSVAAKNGDAANPSPAETRSQMEQPVRTTLRHNGKTAENAVVSQPNSS